MCVCVCVCVCSRTIQRHNKHSVCLVFILDAYFSQYKASITACALETISPPPGVNLSQHLE